MRDELGEQSDVLFLFRKNIPSMHPPMLIRLMLNLGQGQKKPYLSLDIWKCYFKFLQSLQEMSVGSANIKHNDFNAESFTTFSRIE